MAEDPTNRETAELLPQINPAHGRTASFGKLNVSDKLYSAKTSAPSRAESNEGLSHIKRLQKAYRITTQLDGDVTIESGTNLRKHLEKMTERGVVPNDTIELLDKKRTLSGKKLPSVFEILDNYFLTAEDTLRNEITTSDSKGLKNPEFCRIKRVDQTHRIYPVLQRSCVTDKTNNALKEIILTTTYDRSDNAITSVIGTFFAPEFHWVAHQA